VVQTVFGGEDGGAAGEREGQVAVEGDGWLLLILSLNPLSYPTVVLRTPLITPRLLCWRGEHPHEGVSNRLSRMCIWANHSNSVFDGMPLMEEIDRIVYYNWTRQCSKCVLTGCRWWIDSVFFLGRASLVTVRSICGGCYISIKRTGKQVAWGRKEFRAPKHVWKWTPNADPWVGFILVSLHSKKREADVIKPESHKRLTTGAGGFEGTCFWCSRVGHREAGRVSY
jgi:hypothetical protein